MRIYKTNSTFNKWIMNGCTFFVFILLFNACKKTDSYTPYNLNTALNLTTSDSVVVLNEFNKKSTAITFNWTSGTNKGSSSSISYFLQIDKKGSNFASGLKNNYGIAVNTSSYTVEALNTILLSYFAATVGVPIQLEARIVDSISGGTIKGDMSNVITLTITPYAPVSQTLFIIGNATTTGWNTSTAAAMISDVTVPGLFTFQGTLTPGNLKFITTSGNLLPSYNKGIDSLHVVLRTLATDPDNQFTIYKTGVYSITLNLLTLQISITAINAPPFSKLWIVGDATPNGLNINTPNQMYQDLFNPFIFRYNAILSAGEFKIPTSTGNWNCDYYRPLTNDPPITITTATFVSGSTNPPDNKWKISNAGAYKISLNLMNNTININPFTPYKSLWIVGDATPNGWNINSPTILTPVPGDSYTFTYTGPLTVGEFKIPTTTGNWGCSYFRPEINHPAITDTNAPFVASGSGMADTNDFKWYISVAGNYVITFNQLSESITIVKH